jgi:hypothetical protein
MCEIAIFARSDNPVHPMRYQLGDVVEVLPDGASWGTMVARPDSSFRIIAFPGIPMGEASFFVQGKREGLRSFCFDINHPDLPEDFTGWWARNDGTGLTLDHPPGRFKIGRTP